MTVEVEMKDGELLLLFNGETDELLEEQFEIIASDPEAIGGTYYPPVYSLINALNVLKNRMFEKVESVEIIGEIGTIPYEKPKVY